MTPQVDDLNHDIPAVNVTDDREAHPKFWIAAYTRPRSEKKAALELSKLGIEIYLPIQKQLRTWSDRKKMVEVPVIPMIVFARISKNDILTLKRHSLIIKLLSYPGKREAARIPDKEIADLQQMLGQSEIPVSFEFGTFKTGDYVLITQGKLKGIRGQIIEVDKDSSTIWVSVNLLGGAIIKIDNSNLERLQNNTSSRTS